MARPFTDRELQRVLTYVVRTYLEVERGLRPKADLRRFLSREAFNQQYNERASRYGGEPPVRHSDLGPMMFQRPTGDRVHAIVPARQQGDRWGALVLEMRANAKGAWRVTELTRVQDRNLARPFPVSDRSPTGDAAAEYRRVNGDISLVKLARQAADERGASEEVTLWEGQLRSLEQQRDTIRLRVRDSAGPDPVPEYLTGMLGTPPQGEQATSLWNAAADIIEDYRHRWDVESPELALGAVPRHDPQLTDRRKVVRTLRDLATRINEAVKAHEREVGVEGRTSSHDPERGVPPLALGEGGR